MTSALLWGGAALDALNWVFNTLAGSDGDKPLGENLRKISGNLAMAVLGTVASDAVKEALTPKASKVDADPTDRAIEQAWRLAELNALVVFLHRAAKQQSLVAEGYGGEAAAQVIRALSQSHQAVRGNAGVAYAEGVTLSHAAGVLAALTQGDAAGADAHAASLRREIEDRALAELSLRFGWPASPTFELAFRQGLGAQLPPWFGLLTSSFANVLTQKDRQPAQQKLMLRLVARVAVNAQPAVDVQALDSALLSERADQQQLLSERLLRSFEALGERLGSDQQDLAEDVAQVGQQIGSFQAAWHDSQVRLTATLGRVEGQLEEMARLLRLIAARTARPREALPVAQAAEPAAWADLDLGGLPADDAVRHGRNVEFERLRSALQAPSLAVMCIIGRSGAGKTMLVSQALRDRANATRPVVYQPANEANPALWPALLAACDRLLVALGAQAVGSDPNRLTPSSQLHRIDAVLHAAGISAVLVVDSVERVMDGAGRLVEEDLEQCLLWALAHARALRFVVVSQRLPCVAQAGTLRPLNAVNIDRQVQIDLAVGLDREDDALALLHEMLSQGRPDLQDAETRPALALLSRAVGRHPNALKHIAVALLSDRLLTPQRLLASLQSQHAQGWAVQDVRDALVGLGFAQLPAAQQALLQALAVLGGSAGVQAIRAVALPMADDQFTAAVQALLQRHLLRPAGEALTVHDAEKAFYLTTLTEAERQRWHARASAYWRTQASPAATWRGFADALPTVRQLAMLSLARHHGEAATLRLSVARRLCDMGHVRTALHLLQSADPAEMPGPFAWRGAAVRAQCHWKLGAFALAQTACEQGLDAAQAQAVAATEADVLVMRQLHASCRLELGDAGQAVADYDRLLAGIDGLSQPDAAQRLVQARACIDLAFAHSVAGAQPQALTCGERASRLLAQTAPSPTQVLAWAYLGLVHSYVGDFDQAQALYLQATRLAVRIGASYEHAIALGNFAELELVRGRIPQALDRANRALQIEADTDAKNGSWCNWLIAMALALQPGQTTTAERYARRACDYTRLLNDPNPRVTLALLLLRRGQQSPALALLEDVLATTGQLLQACRTNWEALAARALAQLTLASQGYGGVDEALATYRSGRDASPYPGHHARIALQLRLAAPVLQPAGIDIAPRVAALYNENA